MGKRAWTLQAAGVILVSGVAGNMACSRPPHRPDEAPLPRVEVHPPVFLPAMEWNFHGRNAHAWTRRPVREIVLPDFVLLDSIWHAVREQGDTVWTLTATTFSDTVVLPALAWTGGGCQQAVEVPLLVFPSQLTQTQIFPLEIHLQVRTNRDTTWRETTRWPARISISFGSDTLGIRGCPHELLVPDSSSYLWGGFACYGEFEPVAGESLQIRLVFRGGEAPGGPWTVGLWGAGWRRRSEGQETWSLRWGDIRNDLVASVEGVPCDGNVEIRGVVQHDRTPLVDTLIRFHLLPHPPLERFGVRSLVLAENLPRLGDTLLLSVRVNRVEKETLWILPTFELVPVETLFAMASSEPVYPYVFTQEGMLVGRWTPAGTLLERWRWTGEKDTLMRIPEGTLFMDMIYDPEDPDVVVGVQSPVTGGRVGFVVFHPGGQTVDTVDVGLDEYVGLVDIPGRHHWWVVFAALKPRFSGMELWIVDLRWDGQQLVPGSPWKLATWTEYRAVSSFAAVDTAGNRWAVSWTSCEVAFYRQGHRVGVTRHCPSFEKMFWDPEQGFLVGSWLDNPSLEGTRWVVRYEVSGF